ncbi:MAG: DNA repair exonuclease [Clostridia bacterium]|jgi:DNA repair exonuclease SbcCD nuclease subunit
MPIKFYHMADLHLDQPFSTLASVEGFPSKRRDEIFFEFLRVLEIAQEEQPDFIFISGDLYEHEYTRIKNISRINEAFSMLKCNVVMISGNHDPEAKNSFYSSYPWAKNVYILGRKKPYVIFEKKKTCIYGIGYDTGGGQYKTLETIRIDRNYTNVLLMHGDVDLSISKYNAVSSSMLKDIGFDYIAMGHNHKMYIKDRVYNPGSLCALGFDEPGSHGYFKGDLSTGQIEFLESRSRKYVEIEMEYNQIESFEKQYPEKSDIYRIKVIGEKKDEEILKPLEGYEYIQFADRRKAEKNKTAQNLTMGIKSRYVSIMTNKMESAPLHEKKILEDSMELGIKALSGEELDIE